MDTTTYRTTPAFFDLMDNPPLLITSTNVINSFEDISPEESLNRMNAGMAKLMLANLRKEAYNKATDTGGSTI